MVIAMRPESIRPLEDMVLLKIIDNGKTEGGIIIPAIAKTRCRAQVISLGPGRTRETGIRVPHQAQSGDVVWLNPEKSNAPDGRFAGIKLPIDDPEPRVVVGEGGVVSHASHDYLLIHSTELIAIERPDGTIEPIDDFVLLRVYPQGTFVEGGRSLEGTGLVVPDHAQTKSRAVVLARGPGRARDDGRRHELGVTVGSTIWVTPKRSHDGTPRFTGLPMKRLPDQSYLVLVHITEVICEEVPDGTPTLIGPESFGPPAGVVLQ